MKPKFGPTLTRVGGTLALLAATLSVSALAHGPGLQGAPAVPGQLLVRVPAGTTRAAVDALAAEAGCVVVRPLRVASDHYVLRVNGASGGGRAATPATALAGAARGRARSSRDWAQRFG